MAADAMTPMQRVRAAMSFAEPDRVPYFLSLTTTGARQVGMPLTEYFRRPDKIAEAQLRMQERFGHDNLYSATYAANHYEAFGGAPLFFEDSAPVGGPPIIGADDIAGLKAPRVADCACFQTGLEAIRRMRAEVGGDIPIIGFAVGPASMPVHQMGFPAYLSLMYDAPERWAHLLAINEELVNDWIDAQIEAGVDMIGYFDPLASPEMIPAGMWRSVVMAQTQRIIARSSVPCALGYASARSQSAVDALATGAAAVCITEREDLAAVKRAYFGRMGVTGNLNGIKMAHWCDADVEAAVKAAIAQAGPGGGFILSDHQGDIPWLVKEDTLAAIGDAVRKWGRYPLAWLAPRETDGRSPGGLQDPS
jgi:uroporphyrinogen decarboxylase